MGGRSYRQTVAGTPACKKGVESVGSGGLILGSVWWTVLCLALMVFACADGFQVRVAGV